ncbi:MAG: phosphoribosylformylglycinamidine cyclo-ligase [Gammaproteobacteria bacterium]|nr:phosphoribosylformylglycinamidine cyclo-ligase [Gammaproteobacteria bacterium]
MSGLTYREAGVDIDAGNELVRRIAPAAQRTQGDGFLSVLGGFSSLAEVPSSYRNPVLVAGTDGVGTKLKLAIEHDRHDEVGQDLVAMCVNDILVYGAQPFLFLDYYATSQLDVDVAERVIVGIARGCEIAGCALAGGETAEMPGFYRPGDYDLAGFCVGIVERGHIVTGEGIAVGDRLIGVGSTGPHSNGYSLIRRIVEDKGVGLNDALLDQLLAPTRIYARPVAGALSSAPVKGMAHVTGGGIVENVPRMLPKGLAADVDLDSWERPAVFRWLQQAGRIEESEMLRAFNCGIGFVLCVSPGLEKGVLDSLVAAGETAVPIGRIVAAATRPETGHLVAAGDGYALG